MTSGQFVYYRDRLLSDYTKEELVEIVKEQNAMQEKELEELRRQRDVFATTRRSRSWFERLWSK